MDIQEIKKIAIEKWSHFFDKDTLNFFWETMNSLWVETINSQIYIYRKYLHMKESDFSLFEHLKPEDKKAVWKFIETPESAEFHPLKNDDVIFEQIYTNYTKKEV